MQFFFFNNFNLIPFLILNLDFCSQFDDVFNVDVDECVAKYFSQPGQTFQVQSFWSSTWINSLYRYVGAVRFYIKPNPDGTQTSWVRNIYFQMILV